MIHTHVYITYAPQTHSAHTHLENTRRLEARVPGIPAHTCTYTWCSQGAEAQGAPSNMIMCLLPPRNRGCGARCGKQCEAALAWWPRPSAKAHTPPLWAKDGLASLSLSLSLSAWHLHTRARTGARTPPAAPTLCCSNRLPYRAMTGPGTRVSRRHPFSNALHRQ